MSEMRFGTKRSRSRAALLTAGAYHLVHDGYTDVLYVLIPVWQLAFGLSLSQTGWLLTAYLLVMGVFQLPCGLLAERLGERSLLTVGTALAGASCVLLGWAVGFVSLLLVLVLSGLGSSVQHPLSSSLVSSAYPAHERRPALAAYNFSGDIGKVLFPFCAAGLIVWSGWELATAVLGLAGMVLAVSAHPLLRRLDLGSRVMAADTPKRPMRSWGIEERAGFGMLSAIYVIDMVVRYAFLLLLPFALIGKGLDPEHVGFGLTLLFVGGAAGKFGVGYLAHRTGVIPAVVLSEVLTGVSIYCVLVLPLAAVLWLLPLAGVALNGTSSVLYGSVAEFVREERRARAFGLFYTIGILAGSLAPLGAGAGGDWLGIETMITVTAILAFATIPLVVAMRPSLRRAAGLAGN